MEAAVVHYIDTEMKRPVMSSIQSYTFMYFKLHLHVLPTVEAK